MGEVPFFREPRRRIGHTSAALTQPLEVGLVVVQSKRDQHVRDWPAEQVGHQGVVEACGKLAGAHRTAPTNAAEVLGLVSPRRLAVAAKADASTDIEVIARLLKVRSCT